MRRNTFDCLVIGDVMFDVFVGKPGTGMAFLNKGTSYCDFARIEFGGAGNVASALSFLGANASFVGRAGNDLWGRLYKTDLVNRNVKVAVSFDNKVSTGLSLVSVSRDGERSFRVFRGANDRLSVGDINKSIKLLKKSKCLFISGYSLVANPQRNATLHAVRLARESSLKVFFDPGAYNLIETNLELYKQFFDLCDVFCPNIDEARAFTGTTNLEAAVRELQKSRKLVAVKCGTKGCILFNQDIFVKIPGYKTSCVDTTGAGDAFDAALIFGLVNHLPLGSVGQLANWFASQKIGNIGARSFPRKTKISDFLARVGQKRPI